MKNVEQLGDFFHQPANGVLVEFYVDLAEVQHKVTEGGFVLGLEVGGRPFDVGVFNV